MADYRATLNKVGCVLLAFGLADIALMIYCISHDQNYSSSFNIFAVVAGIFLIRGSLRATRVITVVSAFMLTGFIGAILFISPFVQPIGLLATQIKLEPAWTLTLWLITAIALVLLGWIYRQLRTASVLEALKANGHSTATPKLAIGVGIALVAVLAVMLNVTLNGEAGTKAIELARQELGPDYNYSTQSIQWGNSHNRAIVIAYNDHDIRYIPVEWSE